MGGDEVVPECACRAPPSRIRRRTLRRVRAIARSARGKDRRPRPRDDEDRPAGDGRRARWAHPGSGSLPPARAARAFASVRIRHLHSRKCAHPRGRAREAADDRRDGGGRLAMTVTLTGNDLTVEEVVRVARGSEPVELEPGAFERMRECRALVERVIARGDVVYGMTTGVGARKKVPVPVKEIPAFNRALVANHRTATGPDAPAEIVRATMVRLANTLAKGTSGAR